MSTQKNSTSTLWPLVADDAVDRAMNSLIPEAEKLIKDLFDRYSINHNLERSQFTNLITVALETNSVAVVLDYVRYQIGRDANAKSWRIPLGQSSFGAQLLEQLERLRQMAGGLIEEAIRQYGIEPPDRTAEEERLWMLLVRRFVGALHRNFVYYETLAKEGKK